VSLGTTRRQFLGSVVGAAWSVVRPARPSRAVAAGAGCVVLDLKEQCSSRESVAGYQSALAGMRDLPRWRGALIVPAAMALPLPAVHRIVSCLQLGGTVLVESGAGFAAELEFQAHRAALRDGLQVRIEAPVRLWPRTIPYIHYSWPYPADVRDFSRVVPLGRQPGEIIARVDGMPAALKRRYAGAGGAGGTLIFLGSPLGPALWAGDAEAKRWLSRVVAS
jgi:hypothetical protein